MSQLFSFSRFSRLFSRHTAEFLPSYAMATAVLAGALLAVLAGADYLASGPLPVTEQKAFFILFLFAAGSIFTSMAFAPLSDRRQAAAALTLPASHLEKYLVAWLCSLPIFLVVFGAIFCAVNAAVVYGSDWHGQVPQLLNIFSAREKVGVILLFYTAVHAASLLGAIFFEKNHFIKTAFGVLVLAIGLVVANYQVVKAFAGPSLEMASPFSSIILIGAYRVSLPHAQAQWYVLLPLALAVLLWRAAYLRLTEKQL